MENKFSFFSVWGALLRHTQWTAILLHSPSVSCLWTSRCFVIPSSSNAFGTEYFQEVSEYVCNHVVQWALVKLELVFILLITNQMIFQDIMRRTISTSIILGHFHCSLIIQKTSRSQTDFPMAKARRRGIQIHSCAAEPMTKCSRSVVHVVTTEGFFDFHGSALTATKITNPVVHFLSVLHPAQYESLNTTRVPGPF